MKESTGSQVNGKPSTSSQPDCDGITTPDGPEDTNSRRTINFHRQCDDRHENDDSNLITHEHNDRLEDNDRDESLAKCLEDNTLDESFAKTDRTKLNMRVLQLIDMI